MSKKFVVVIYTIPGGISALSWRWGLASSNDLKICAGGSVATGRVSQAGQVKSEVPD
jgi:hypothetical protein